ARRARVPLRRRRSRRAHAARHTSRRVRAPAARRGARATRSASRRDGGRRATGPRRAELRAPDRRRRARARHRARGARARRRVAGRARARVPARLTQPRAGLDEPRRARTHGGRAGLRRGARAGTAARLGRRPRRARRSRPGRRARPVVARVPRPVGDQRGGDDRSAPRPRRRRGALRRAGTGWRGLTRSGRTRAEGAVTVTQPRTSRGRRGATGERALAAEAATLPLGQAAPDAELLAVAQRVLEALEAHLAAAAHGLRLPGGRTTLGEEQVGVDAEAIGPLLPAAFAVRRIGR